MSQADAAPITGAYDFAPDMSAGFIAAVSPSATDSFSDGCASPTRRGMLGGLLLASVVAAVSPPSLAAALSSPWHQAMAKFEAARAAEIAHDRDVWMPAERADKISSQIEAASDRLADCRSEAEDALIATPAPQLSAVIWKIQHARERWADFDAWPDSWWQNILMDLTRLDASMGGC